MEQIAFNPIELGKGISEFGFLIMCSASYLLTSAVLLFIFIRWFSRLFDNILDRQYRILENISEGIRDIRQKLS